METTKTGGVCVSIYIYIWIILGLYWDTGKENGNYQNGGCVCVYIYIYGLYWGYIGIMEKKMETTKTGGVCVCLSIYIYMDYIGVILG